MKKKLISLLLVGTLLLALVPGALAVSPYEEAGSAAELMELLAPRARVLRAVKAPAAPAYVLLLADTLPDTCGAQRVLHYGAYDQFVLEYADQAAAEAARDTYINTYGLDRCWVDGAGACVLDPTETEPPEETEAPEVTPTPEPEETPEPAESPEPTVYTARSWGAQALGLDTFRTSNAVQKHCVERTVTVAVLDTGADTTVSVLQDRTISAASYDFVNRTKDVSDVTQGNAAGHGTMVTTLLDDLLPEIGRAHV